MKALLPTQIIDSETMASSDHGLNWSKPGAGKTLCALNSFNLRGAERCLVVAPPIALTMWAQEATSFLGMSTQVLRTGKAPIIGEPDVVVTSFSLAAAGQNEQLDHYFSQRDGHQHMIIDEAHFLANRMSKRAMALWNPAGNGRNSLFELFDSSDSLTGTPIPRYNDGVWAQLRMTRPDVLAKHRVLDYDAFVAAFCYKQKKQYHPRQRPTWYVSGNTNLERFGGLLDECGIVRREIPVDMPVLTVRVVDAMLVGVGELTRMTQGLSPDRVAQLMSEQNEEGAAARRLLGIGKAPSVGEYVADACQHGPVLVGFWHREVATKLKGILLDCGVKTVAVIDGSTPAHVCDNVQAAFNAGQIDVVLGQMGKMSVSWNLQERCRHVVVAEDHYSPTVVEQFYKRVYRMGQKEHVQLDFAKADHIADQMITLVRERKASNNEITLSYVEKKNG